MLILAVVLFCGWIAYQLFIPIKNSVNAYWSKKSRLEIEVEELYDKDKKRVKEIETLQAESSRHRNKVTSVEREIDSLRKTIEEKDKLFEGLKDKTDDSISQITSLYSDFLLVQYDISEKHNRTKKHPAKVRAQNIKELKKETKGYIEQQRLMLYKYEYLLQIFPELSDYVDDFESLTQLDEANSIDDIKDEYDRVQNFLNKEEYERLTENHNRNQLALDRYITSKKSNWQIGRDYEMFCGWQYQLDGWEVEYFGMEKRLKDLGRDLIVRKGDEVQIIQCKYWSQKKVIHEKHILQLYGTTEIEKLTTNPDFFRTVKPVFVTNISLSDTAMKFARILGVKVLKMEMGEYPMIKCNIGVDENNEESKIYHLPFDQHYDRTKIVKGQGFYAKDVYEAEHKGFRRAYKYRYR